MAQVGRRLAGTEADALGQGVVDEAHAPIFRYPRRGLPGRLAGWLTQRGRAQRLRLALNPKSAYEGRVVTALLGLLSDSFACGA